MVAPVMKAAPSEHRKAAVAAISCGRPMRPTGMNFFMPSTRFWSLVRVSAGVSMAPGEMALQVMPARAPSCAAVFIRPSTAALNAA